MKRVLIILMILNSLLNERWSISFKLYKRKKKPHIVNVQFTELLAKPIKETLIIQKPIDCKLNWRPIAGTMIINVCYTVFYNVKLGISFPHRGLWSTRFVWDSDSKWAASVVPPCSQSDPGTGPAAIPAPRPWGCTEGGNRVYKVPATSWINRSPTHTKEWLNYLVKHFWQPGVRTARVVRAELSWVSAGLGEFGLFPCPHWALRGWAGVQ